MATRLRKPSRFSVPFGWVELSLMAAVLLFIAFLIVCLPLALR
jgi:hypothetical protein